MTHYDYKTKICIVGLGPAGIGCAYTLLHSKLASSTLCLDAGKSPNHRSCAVLQNKSCAKCNPCEIVSGFGGCALLGGGKISTYPAGSKFVDIIGSVDVGKKKLLKGLSFFNNRLNLQKPDVTLNDIRYATEFFRNLGFEYKYYDSYLYNLKEFQQTCQNVFSELKSAGMNILLNTELVELEHKGNGFKLIAKRDKERLTIFSKYLVLGVGRLGRGLLKSINAKFNLGGKENQLDVGVRLEFPTALYPDITKYHNDLKLLFNNARTFCVCKDGKIAPYLLDEIFFIGGYLNPTDKSGFTNMGILIRTEPSRLNDALYYKIKKKTYYISNGKPMCQSLLDYIGSSTEKCGSPRSFDIKSSISYWTKGDINQCFTQPISAKIRKAVYFLASQLLPKDYWYQVNVFAPIVEYGALSFPVNPDFSILPRMYLIGDCSGRFRGILQAFCSGMVCAESIIGDENEDL